MDQPHLTSKLVSRDLETTYDLLEATMPSIKSPDTNLQKAQPKSPWTAKLESGKTPSPYVCSSEDEIFFGSPTEKEMNGKSAKQVQNWTTTKNGRRRTLKMDTTKWRQQKSTYNVENSIEEGNENEENCPPSLKLNDQSITPTEKSPSKGSKLKENLEPLHDTNKNDDKLETVINQLANLHSPTKEPATPNFNKVPCEEIQSDGKLPVNCSPIPSPRKVRNATVKNDNSTNKEIYSKEVFGERLVENNLASFKQLASVNKSNDQDVSNCRKYRSRSPLMKEATLLKEANSSYEKSKYDSDEKEHNNLENMNPNEIEENSSTPTPKLRTKYFDPMLHKNSGLSHNDKATELESEISSKHTSNLKSESNSSKWKRRSIKQDNCESDDSEIDNDLSVVNTDPVTIEQQPKLDASPNNIQDAAKEIEDSNNVDLENEKKFQHLLTAEAVSDTESSIIDVNNDQMFDDTVFTDYDDINISKMTQKMSTNWRNKFKKEERAEFRRKKDNLSLEELVERQTDKNYKSNDSNQSKREDILNVTNNRTRRRKPMHKTVPDFRLSSSDLGTTVVNETPSSASTSISGESQEAKCIIGSEKYDIDAVNKSKAPTLNEECKESEISMPPEQPSPNADNDADADNDNSNISTCSDWFNTTRDEMILYEKFGEDYDIIVEKMTKEEKIKLKKEVSESSPKEAEELLGINKMTAETFKDNDITIPENKEEKMPPLSSSNTNIEQVPNMPIDRYTEISNSFTSEKQNSAQLKHIGKPSELDRDNLNQHNYEIDSISELAPYVNSNKNLEAKNDKFCKGFIKSTSTSLESLGEEIKTTAEKNKCLQDLERSNNSDKCHTLEERISEDRFHTVNDNSLLARVQKAQEELRKDNFIPENVKSSGNSKHTPIRNQQKERIFGTPTAKDFKFKTPTSGKTGHSTGRTANYSSGNHFGTKINNGGGKSSVPSYQRDTVASTFKRSPAKNKTKSTPSSGNIFPSPLDFGSKRGLPCSVVDMDKIISPIAQYINANPVPPSMKHIRPKTSKFLDSEIQESLQDQDIPSPKITQAAKKIFAPLPAAKYCSSKVAIQIPVAPDSQPKELPKAFGITNTVQAKVVKHVFRTKVPRNLPQEEIVKASENMKPLSPNAIQFGIPTIHQRESILMSRESNIGGTSIDQSTMEMSVQETKEIKKPTSATLERKLL